jgi:hypothetical protein
MTSFGVFLDPILLESIADFHQAVDRVNSRALKQREKTPRARKELLLRAATQRDVKLRLWRRLRDVFLVEHVVSDGDRFRLVQLQSATEKKV